MCYGLIKPRLNFSGPEKKDVWQKNNKANHQRNNVLTVKHGGGNSKLWA